MTEEEAKTQLQGMLKHFATGRILGLLGELHLLSAHVARQCQDLKSASDFRATGSTLLIVGAGIDSNCPR